MSRRDLEFKGKYEDEAHMQHSFNEVYMKNLVVQFQRKFPDKSARIECLDIGCGGGKTSRDFYQALQAEGYKNLYVTGLDISEEQIKTANENLDISLKDHIHYVRGDALDIETNFDPSHFDCVFSFFTFHWIDDKSKLSRSIANSLKPEGLLFYLTVTALPQWFSIRKKLLEELAQHPDWEQYFKGFDIRPFADYPASERAFENDFCTLSSEPKAEFLEYSGEEFRDFLKSWLPEVRCLRHKDAGDDVINRYLDFLLEKIPANQQADVSRQGQSAKIKFMQRYGVFTGIKKEEESELQSPGQLPSVACT